MRSKRRVFVNIDCIRSICSNPPLYVAWCRGCCQETEMVTFPEAANIICKDMDKIIKQTANGNVHLGIRPEALLVCLNSLLRVNRILSI